MKDNKLTIQINKPVADVFAFCITPPKAKLWVPNIINGTTSELSVKIGIVYTEYKDDNTSFNIIVTKYKEKDYIEWRSKRGIEDTFPLPFDAQNLLTHYPI